MLSIMQEQNLIFLVQAHMLGVGGHTATGKVIRNEN